MAMEPWYKYFMGIDYDDDSEQLIESKKLISFCHVMNIACETLCCKKVIEL